MVPEADPQDSCSIVHRLAMVQLQGQRGKQGVQLEHRYEAWDSALGTGPLRGMVSLIETSKAAESSEL